MRIGEIVLVLGDDEVTVKRRKGRRMSRSKSELAKLSQRTRIERRRLTHIGKVAVSL